MSWNKLTPEQAVATLKDRYPNLDFAATTYHVDAGNKQLVSFRCSLHGVQTQYYNVLVATKSKGKHGCAKCNIQYRGQQQVRGWSEVLADLIKIHGTSTYEFFPETYQSVMLPMKVVCHKHATPVEWWPNANNMISKASGCPACGNRDPKQQRFIYDALVSVGAEKGRRDLLDGQEIDVFFPRRKVGVEINGMYWHGEHHKPKFYHSDKYEAARDAKIRLLQFWDFEVDDKPKIVLGMIRNRLGISKRVGARVCTVEVVSSSEARTFLSDNHIQGACKSKVYLGLRYQGRLAAVMSFSTPRFDDTHQWELVRFASHVQISVVGGASRLWAAFLAEHAPESVVSYANRRYSDGNLYEKLGFTLSHVSNPNYFWAMNTHIRLSRYASQKHNLAKTLGDKFDPNLSEVDNMHSAGYYRVYDAGNYVYHWFNE